MKKFKPKTIGDLKKDWKDKVIQLVMAGNEGPIYALTEHGNLYILTKKPYAKKYKWKLELESPPYQKINHGHKNS